MEVPGLKRRMSFNRAGSRWIEGVFVSEPVGGVQCAGQFSATGPPSNARLATGFATRPRTGPRCTLPIAHCPLVQRCMLAGSHNGYERVSLRGELLPWFCGACCAAVCCVERCFDLVRRPVRCTETRRRGTRLGSNAPVVARPSVLNPDRHLRVARVALREEFCRRAVARGGKP